MLKRLNKMIKISTYLLQHLYQICTNLLQKLRECREKRVIKKLKTVTHSWWNNVDTPTAPLTEELFEKCFKDFNKKPPRYIYFVRKATIFEKIWYTIKKWLRKNE